MMKNHGRVYKNVLESEMSTVLFLTMALNAYRARNALQQDDHVGVHVTYAVDDWVVVQYDNKQYFGEIVAVVKGEDMSCDFEVNVMHEQRGGVFKWHVREDKILYKEGQIVKKKC